MKFLTDKLRTKSFWVALIGALTLIIARQCNITTEAISEIVEGIGGLLVLLGIVASPPGSTAGGEKSESDKLPDEDGNDREE